MIWSYVPPRKKTEKSDRFGGYLLADDLYQDLKDIIKENMAKEIEDKGEQVDEKAFESVTHEIRTCP